MQDHTLKMTLKGLAAALLLTAASAASAQTSATYSGQGLNSNPDGFGGYDLNKELCGVQNGADAEGPYILWLFTATGAKTATITGPWGTASMTKMGNGTFKYVSAWYDPSTLPGNVTATSVGGKVKKPQLTVSHGCRPFRRGAWCSPGFWHNATDAAWTLTGQPKTTLFNTTVYSAWYGASYAADPSLITVVTTTGSTYKGPGVAGTLGYSLNAFNATGAYLTNNIPGYQFSLETMEAAEGSDTCPIDHFGNFKQ
jgi:hypothetical protein